MLILLLKLRGNVYGPGIFEMVEKKLMNPITFTIGATSIKEL